MRKNREIFCEDGCFIEKTVRRQVCICRMRRRNIRMWNSGKGLAILSIHVILAIHVRMEGDLLYAATDRGARKLLSARMSLYGKPQDRTAVSESDIQRIFAGRGNPRRNADRERLIQTDPEDRNRPIKSDSTAFENSLRMPSWKRSGITRCFIRREEAGLSAINLRRENRNYPGQRLLRFIRGTRKRTSNRAS